MSTSHHCDSTADGVVMPTMVFPSRPAENGFMSSDAPFQVDTVGLNGFKAMDQSESNTLFRNPRNVRQWAVCSANGQASVMNAYAAQHVNPVDLSQGVSDSFPFGPLASQENPFGGSTECQVLQDARALPNMDAPFFGQISPNPSDFAPVRSYEDANSDAPSLEWGPSICSNSSADDGRSSNFQLDLPSAIDGISGHDLVEDGKSSHFQLEDLSQVDVVSSSGMLEGHTLYSPSINSIEFLDSNFSPLLMPSSGSMEPSCLSSTAQQVSFDASIDDDFMSQFTNEGQNFMSGSNYSTSDMQTAMHISQGQDTDDLFSPVEASVGPAYPYPGTDGAQTFSSQRWNADGEGIGARSHQLYQVSAGPDGLYHCPFANDMYRCTHKADKLKCNYDKHLDSHLKPYRCNELDPECEGKQFSSTACLLRHQRERHGMHGHGDCPFMCHYDGCDRAQPGHGFPRHWNLNDHMKRMHNYVVEGQSKAPKGRKGSDSAGLTRSRVQKKSRAMSG